VRAGYLLTFFYLLCGAVRLARFNVQTNPTPKNLGRPDHKYFVGMPIPAGAAFVAAVVLVDPIPVRGPVFAVIWLAGIAIVGLLMVSTWRYPSFKHFNLSRPHATISVLFIGLIAILIFAWPQPVLLAAASAYVASGIVIRLGGAVRRYRRARTNPTVAEHQIG
jgi:CDP-diacylglycerol--serine O-phosphatidyltransferase